jgi:hypothetical protein
MPTEKLSRAPSLVYGRSRRPCPPTTPLLAEALQNTSLAHTSRPRSAGAPAAIGSADQREDKGMRRSRTSSASRRAARAALSLAAPKPSPLQAEGSLLCALEQVPA